MHFLSLDSIQLNCYRVKCDVTDNMNVKAGDTTVCIKWQLALNETLQTFKQFACYGWNEQNCEAQFVISPSLSPGEQLTSSADCSCNVATCRDLDNLNTRQTSQRPQRRAFLTVNNARWSTLQQTSEVVVRPAVDITWWIEHQHGQITLTNVAYQCLRELKGQW